LDRSGLHREATQAERQSHGIDLQLIKLAEVKKGFVLLPKRWVAERGFAGAARFRRLAKDRERLPDGLRGLLFLIFVIFTSCCQRHG
jgi:transposase